MNICVLVNSFTLGGAEKVVVTLLDKYKKKGVNCTIVCLERNNFYDFDGAEIVYLSEECRGDEPFHKKLIMLLVYAFRLKSFLRTNHLNLVQSHLYRANYVNVLARLIGSHHKTQIVNHGIVHRYKNMKSLTSRINLFLVKVLYGRADQVVLACQGMKNDLEKMGAFKNDLCVINNPFDIQKIAALKSEPIGNDEFIFDPDTAYLVSVGRLEEIKKITDIIKVVENLRKNDRNVELIILGDGPAKVELMTLADALQITEQVHFLGMVKNPFKYISKADILVSASASEGFGNVIVEAFVSGTAVVSTDCEGGPREIIAPGSGMNTRLKPGAIEYAEYGVLVPVGDYPKMAEAVGELLADAVRLKHYSSIGIVRAKDFEAGLIADRYIEQMKSLSHEAY